MKRILFIIAIAALVAFLAYRFPYAISNEDDKMRLVYLGLILAFMSLGVRQFPMSQALKYAAGWLVIGAVIIYGYSHRYDILNSRIMAELMPSLPRVDGEGNVTIRSGYDGHFHVEARANGVPVSFMIDTGATDVVLTKSDAERIGIDTSALNYNRVYQTANGQTRGAVIKLGRLQIATFMLEDFPVSVNEGELGSSLLGMSALRKLGGFKIDGDKMIIGKER